MQSYFDFLGKIFGFLPFNIFDIVILITLALYVIEDAIFGMVSAGIGFAAIVAAFFTGLILYSPLSNLLVNVFSLTKGISDAIAFLLVTCIAFILFSILFAYIRSRYIKVIFPPLLDKIGGAVFGFLSFFFISSFAISLLLSFPVSTIIKNSIKSSISGKFLFARTQGMEGYVRQVFGGAIQDTINFLTVEPESSDSVDLRFKTNSYKQDKKAENQMLSLINQERAKKSLSPLVMDTQLQQVGLLHAADMLKRGYFSHYTPEGLSPFDRMAQSNVGYQSAGENLAFAPDVNIAMDGLMKSPGHRANILSPNFHRVGIGVLDAGIYGEMFVQEFTD